MPARAAQPAPVTQREADQARGQQCEDAGLRHAGRWWLGATSDQLTVDEAEEVIVAADQR